MKKALITLLIGLIFAISAAAASATDYTGQPELIAAHADLWKQNVDYGQWGYAVTDLDQNGQLEILAASLQGTGFYTYLNIYEVSEDSSGLTEVRQDRSEYESTADIMTETAAGFYDKEKGVYFYIFPDFVRNGYAENCLFKRSVCLENGVWKEQTLAQKAAVCSDPENCTFSFQDDSGQAISEEQFESIENTLFSELEEGMLRLHWNMTDNEAFSRISADELCESLKNIAVYEATEHR